MSKVAVLLLSIGALLVAYHQSAIATQAAPSGITITPPISTISLPADQTRYRFTVMLQNHEDHGVNLTVRAEDFGNLDETGGVYFLGSEPSERWDPHRLADWMTISPQSLRLNPGEQEEVVVEILNDHNLSPGGHYGALVASIDTRRNDSDIAINQALSALLFVNKIGGEEYRINVQSVDTEPQWWGGVNDVAIKIQNTGNTHLIPRGSVTLEDPLERTISQGVINTTSTILLPDSSQAFEASLTQTALPLWPGKYTLVLAYRYDGQDELMSIERNYYSIGLVGVAGLVVVMCGAISFGVKRYVSHQN